MNLEVTKNSDASPIQAPELLQHDVVAEIRNCFYQCQYQLTLQKINKILNENFYPEKFFELTLLKSHTLYELHEIKAAHRVIQEAFEEVVGTPNIDMLYAKATLAYFDGEISNALQIFSKSLERTQNHEDTFKALLGIGNAYYSLKEYRNVYPYLKELSNMENFVKDDSRISYYLLCANTYLYSETDEAIAKKYFEQAYELSVKKSWNYFTQRALYGLACFEKIKGDPKKLSGILSILNLSLKVGESKFLTFLTNKKFGDSNFNVSQDIQIDSVKKTLLVKGEVYNFSHSPLMFTIIELLSTQNIFFSKAEIAKSLWPHEDYKKRTHDPRIYDLIKRIRRIVEAVDTRPLVILSNPHGYKLSKH